MNTARSLRFAVGAGAVFLVGCGGSIACGAGAAVAPVDRPNIVFILADDLGGGFRVPLLVQWKGRIAAGTTSDRVTGFEDWLPTLLELAGAKAETPRGIDGVSFAPTLRGRRQRERAFLYRESPGYGGQQCVRVGAWKAVRQNLNPGPHRPLEPRIATELYDLAGDPLETTNVAEVHPGRVRRLERILRREHTPSDLWPIRALDWTAADP